MQDSESWIQDHTQLRCVFRGPYVAHSPFAQNTIRMLLCLFSQRLSSISEPYLGSKSQDAGCRMLYPVQFQDLKSRIGIEVLDPGFRMLDPGSRIQNNESRFLDPGSWPGCWIWIRHPGSWIQEAGTSIHDAEPRILDQGSWIP